MHQEFSTADITQAVAPEYTQLVSIIVHWQDALLLIHRITPPFKDLWSIPGGSIEEHETYEQAARRELYEETGIQADSLRAQYVFFDHKHKLECHIFSYMSPDGSYSNPEPDEHDIVTWKSIPEALELSLTPGLYEAFQRLAAARQDK